MALYNLTKITKRFLLLFMAEKDLCQTDKEMQN